MKQFHSKIVANFWLENKFYKNLSHFLGQKKTIICSLHTPIFLVVIYLTRLFMNDYELKSANYFCLKPLIKEMIC